MNPMSITIGAVAGAPFKPAPTIDRPIDKKIVVKRSFVGMFIPSLSRSLDIAFDTIDVNYYSFLALSRGHLNL